jgi:hypothetical protein
MACGAYPWGGAAADADTAGVDEVARTTHTAHAAHADPAGADSAGAPTVHTIRSLAGHRASSCSRLMNEARLVLLLRGPVH